MNIKNIVHELTMKHLERTYNINSGPADYAEAYLQTFNSIEGYLVRKNFDTTGEAPEWK